MGQDQGRRFFRKWRSSGRPGTTRADPQVGRQLPGVGGETVEAEQLGPNRLMPVGIGEKMPRRRGRGRCDGRVPGFQGTHFAGSPLAADGERVGRRRVYSFNAWAALRGVFRK